MQLADILSDLSTLRTCDPQDALNLVTLPRSAISSSPPSSLKPTADSPTTNTTTNTETETDADLLRAKSFLRLHSSLKAWDSRKLQELRWQVDAIVDGKLGRAGSGNGMGMGDDMRHVSAPGGF